MAENERSRWNQQEGPAGAIYRPDLDRASETEILPTVAKSSVPEPIVKSPKVKQKYDYLLSRGLLATLGVVGTGILAIGITQPDFVQHIFPPSATPFPDIERGVGIFFDALAAGGTMYNRATRRPRR